MLIGDLKNGKQSKKPGLTKVTILHKIVLLPDFLAFSFILYSKIYILSNIACSFGEKKKEKKTTLHVNFRKTHINLFQRQYLMFVYKYVFHLTTLYITEYNSVKNLIICLVALHQYN